MHHAIGAIAIIGLIAFAFGEKVAQVVVAAALLVALSAFAYVMFLIVMDLI